MRKWIIKLQERIYFWLWIWKTEMELKKINKQIIADKQKEHERNCKEVDCPKCDYGIDWKP